MDFKIMLCSSLTKVMPQEEPAALKRKTFSVLKGEKFSFQLASLGKANWFSHLIPVTVESELKKYIRIRSVENVPVEWMPDQVDDDVVSNRIGFYPDVLRDLPEGKYFRAHRNIWNSLWFDVNVPKTCKAGKYSIKITLSVPEIDLDANPEFNESGREEFTQSLTLEVIDAVLPPQKLKNTHWFHSDCLMEHYGFEAFSPAYWDCVSAFMKTAADHGINMILTPIFTPPLDTRVGGERPTVQLVKVKYAKGKYSFDFALLEKWIDVAGKAGIKYFEMSHLFTQWGAGFTPKIMAEVNGKEKRIFGWDVAATSKKYQDFLKAFLPELVAFIDGKKLHDKVYFHCSDEPSLAHLENYKKASTLLRKYLKDFRIFDALSKPDFYQNGLISIPVPSETHLDQFMSLDVPERWTYYCCEPLTEYSNRFIYMTSSRNRTFGLLLYYYGVEGFLHWGFNFYNACLSAFKIDPYTVTCANYTYPAGDGFLVYPGANGKPEDSLRLEVFHHGLQDQRALELLEKLIGRDKVLKLLDSAVPGGKMSMKNYLKGEDALWNLREKVNSLIKKNLPRSK